MQARLVCEKSLHPIDSARRLDLCRPARWLSQFALLGGITTCIIAGGCSTCKRSSDNSMLRESRSADFILAHAAETQDLKGIPILSHDLVVHNGFEEYTVFYATEVMVYPRDKEGADVIVNHLDILKDAFVHFWECKGADYFIYLVYYDVDVSPILTHELNVSLHKPLIASVSIGTYFNYHDYGIPIEE